jgi:hypothetical protein
MAVECGTGPLWYGPVPRGGIQISFDGAGLDVVDSNAPAPHLPGQLVKLRDVGCGAQPPEMFFAPRIGRKAHTVAREVDSPHPGRSRTPLKLSRKANHPPMNPTILL